MGLEESGLMKGSYILVVRLQEDDIIEVGALGRVHFKAGFYVYTGSAFNSLHGRISRHLRKEKKLFWHIDHLLQRAEVDSVWVLRSGERMECRTAGSFRASFTSVKAFGCSDCSCPSHLFYSVKREDLEGMAKERGYSLVENLEKFA